MPTEDIELLPIDFIMLSVRVGILFVTVSIFPVSNSFVVCFVAVDGDFLRNKSANYLEFLKKVLEFFFASSEDKM